MSLLNATLPFPRPQRPSWTPEPARQFWVGIFLALPGVLGVTLSDRSDTLHSIFWLFGLLFVGVAIVTLLIWLFRTLRQEQHVVTCRYRNYEPLYNKLVLESSLLSNEKSRVLELSKQVAVHGHHQSRAKMLAYPLSHCFIDPKSDDVLVTVEDENLPIIPPGTRLDALDEQTGEWRASMEMTNERTINGAYYIRILEWDPVFLGYIRSQAEQGTKLETRTKVFYTLIEDTSEGGAPDDKK